MVDTRVACRLLAACPIHDGSLAAIIVRSLAQAADLLARRYETVACHRQCRWDFDWPPIKQFKLGFTLGLKLFGGWAWGSGDSRPLVTFSPAPMKGCLAAPPSCTGKPG